MRSSLKILFVRKVFARRAAAAFGLLLLTAFCSPPNVSAQYAQPPVGPVPTGNSTQILKKVGIDQKLNNQLPLDLKFRDEYGRDVRLGDYFQSGRPVVEVAGVTLGEMACGEGALATCLWTGCPIL